MYTQAFADTQGLDQLCAITYIDSDEMIGFLASSFTTHLVIMKK